MNLTIVKPKIALNSAYQRQTVSVREILSFKSNLSQLFRNIDPQESEENAKNHLKEFLYDTYYKNLHEINTKGRTDLVIYLGESAKKSKAGVLLEVKRPTNKIDMVEKDNLNFKAMHELILYYLRERIENDNTDIKHLIATNIYEWYIFDVSVFDKLFYKSTHLRKEYIAWKEGRKARKDTDFFYTDIARPFLNQLEDTIQFTYCDLNDYHNEIESPDIEENEKLISLFKLLSPTHLLKLPFANDSNSLVPEFYRELLYILGLEEAKEGGKRIIKRASPQNRNEGALMENIITKLKSHRILDNFKNEQIEGENEEQKYFNIALELTITWMNRILFLKLLESQMLAYHNNKIDYAFLSSQKITEFDNLDTLFFEVLAEQVNKRNPSVRERYPNTPYLNSSLFEPTKVEQKAIYIATLKDNLTLPIYSRTVLKNTKGKSLKGLNKSTLEYLLDFLEAYDFGTEGKETIKEESKTIINASVLGLIFEKINGYKEGSFFTPGFITEHICRETIRRTIVDKFREQYKKSFTTFGGLANFLNDFYEPKELLKANEVFNSIKICDPAVGSGHFLVSALNEMIAVKSELGILCDKQGKKLKDYTAKVENDELVLEDREGNLFAYGLKEGKPNPEIQRIQETIFHEKETIIENCLFGVDINANSVKICRLRLWIELLKNAYYTKESNYKELETLPNLDINIKQGNSLVNRFHLDADLSKALKSIKYNIDDYRYFVNQYRHATDKDEKRGFQKLIDQIKSDFRTEIGREDPKQRKLDKLSEQLFYKYKTVRLVDVELTKKQKEQIKKERQKLEKQINKLAAEIDEIKNNKVYHNAFEWRFEFPEVLNEKGEFTGFDAIIGNPPYIKEYESKKAFDGTRNLPCYQGKMDLWYLFGCTGLELLKKDAYLCFIATNNWVTNAGASKFRNRIIKDTQIIQLNDFGSFMVFDTASVQTMIMLFQKNNTTDNYTFDYRHLDKSKPEKDDAENMLLKEENPAITYLTPKMTKENYLNKLLHFTDSEIEDLLNKISEKANLKLDKKTEVAQGIVTPQDSVNKASQKKLGDSVNVGDGIFILSDDEYQSMNFNQDEEKLIKPCYSTTELGKYYGEANNKHWIIYTNSSFKKPEKIEPYPNIKAHLDKFQPVITSHNKPYGLHRSREQSFFEGEKILSLRKCLEPTFTYTDFPCYAVQSFFIIKSKRIDLKYLTGLLNSNLIAFWLKHRGKMQGNNYQVDKEPLLNLPILKPSEHETQRIATLVDRIIARKQQGGNIENLEAEIDKIVYGLYGLDNEEVEIVQKN